MREPQFVLSTTDRVVKCTVVVIGSVACLVATAWTLWARYNATQEVVGAMEHSLQLQEFMQDLAGLLTCLEFGFLLEVSTSLLARTHEFMDAEQIAEGDMMAVLSQKVNVRLKEMHNMVQGNSDTTSLQSQLGTSELAFRQDVQLSLSKFTAHVAKTKAATLQKTERALWERVAMWEVVQERLLTMSRRVSVQAADNQERQEMVISNGGGASYPGLGRYINNFFVNLEMFQKKYKGRAPLDSSTRKKIEGLRSSVTSHNGLWPNETALSHQTTLQLAEKELRELIRQTELPPYISQPFNHQLEAYTNDVLFVDHMLRLSKSSLDELQTRQSHKSATDTHAFFKICLEVVQLAGLRKVPIRWLVDPRATRTSRWPSIDHFDTKSQIAMR